MRMRTLTSTVTLIALASTLISAQPQPSFTPGELDRLVAAIALYPDPLLGHVLAAATYSAQIPEAARWADDHHYLTGKQFTDAVAADRVPWDPTVQALLPFPSVLELMAGDMPWTEQLGDAFLVNAAGVMDAVQRLRRVEVDYGYLKLCTDVVIRTGPPVEILPANPAFIAIPYYSSAILLAPRAFADNEAVFCGYGITLGPSFQPWGWGATQFEWRAHVLTIGSAPWRRTWGNRVAYVHPYPNVPRFTGPRAPESHAPRPRTPQERGRERPSAAVPGHQPQR